MNRPGDRVEPRQSQVRGPARDRPRRFKVSERLQVPRSTLDSISKEVTGSRSIAGPSHNNGYLTPGSHAGSPFTPPNWNQRVVSSLSNHDELAILAQAIYRPLSQLDICAYFIDNDSLGCLIFVDVNLDNDLARIVNGCCPVEAWIVKDVFPYRYRIVTTEGDALADFLDQLDSQRICQGYLYR